MLIYTLMFLGLNILFHRSFNLEHLKTRYPKDYIFRLFSLYFVCFLLANFVTSAIVHEDYTFVIAILILLSVGVTTIHYVLEFLNQPLNKLFDSKLKNYPEALYALKLVIRWVLFFIFIYISMGFDHRDMSVIEPVIWMYRFLVILFFGIELDLLIQTMDEEDRFDYFYLKQLERVFILLCVYQKLYPVGILPLLIRVVFVFIPKYKQNRVHILLDILINGAIILLGYLMF